MLKMSQILNVKNLPVADNVCAQVLREVEKQPGWSMAHVTMNPFAESLLHVHKEMTEIYVITKGHGKLGVWDVGEYDGGEYNPVVAGSVCEIPPHSPHILINKSGGHLEHLVFALPPFDPSDVNLLKQDNYFATREHFSLSLPTVQECFDGARILSYSFPKLDFSIAFGRVINDPSRHKQPHYHKERTEFVYVAEGKGFINLNGTPRPVESGNWICISPGTKHSFLNISPEDMVVVCVCSPAFSMDDVHYR